MVHYDQVKVERHDISNILHLGSQDFFKEKVKYREQIMDSFFI
jgi:hypothetical protein